MKKRFLFLTFIYTFSFIIPIFAPADVSAFGNQFEGLTPFQKDVKAIHAGSTHYEPTDLTACDLVNPTNTENIAPFKAGSSVYMVGDSIGVGLVKESTGLVNRTKEIFDSDMFYNVEGGRAIINGGGNTPVTNIREEPGVTRSGLQAVEDDQETIEDAGAIIIVLGTNPESGDFEEHLTNLVEKMKDYNSTATYYWLDIGANVESLPHADIDDAPAYFNERNRIIYDKADELGYTVISRYKAVFGADKDPLDIDSSLDGLFDGIHGAYSDTADEIMDVLGGNVTTGDVNLDVNTVDNLRDKIAQLLFVRVNSVSNAQEAVGTHHVGGLFVSNEWFQEAGQNPETAKQNMDSVVSQFNIAPFVGIDEEGGEVHRLKEMHGDMPNALTQGSMSNEELIDLGVLWGQRMKDVGVTTNLAPVLDLHNPDNPIIGALGRGYSSDPAVVAEKAGAFAQGLRQAGITPTFKHFPGHGNASGDSHLGRVETSSLDILRTSDLVPYETSLDNPNSMVMMGHLDVPGLTAENEPTSISPAALDLLRDEYGFGGIVMTDDLGDMIAINSLYSLPESVEKAILAGNDLALFNGLENVGAIIDHLESQANSNPELLQRIEDSSMKVLAFKGNNLDYSPGTSVSDNCVCGGSGDSTIIGGDNVEISYNFLVGKGLTTVQAAGIVGNLKLESSPVISPTITNPKSGAYGIAQWLGGRLEGLRNFAAENGYNPDSLEGQLEYLWWEISSEDSIEKITYEVLEAIQDSNDIEEIAILWAKLFERATDTPETLQLRIAYSASVLAEFGSNTAPTGSGNILCNTDPSGQIVGGFSLPLDRSWFEDNPGWLTKPHWGNSPASDIPVPTGTPVYSMSDGVIRTSGGDCGVGVSVDTDDGNTFIYCHGSDGGSVEGAKPGDSVSAGQLIMHSASTGHSTGPHLHVGISAGGASVCPQPLFEAIFNGGVIPELTSLPSTRCNSGSSL